MSEYYPFKSREFARVFARGIEAGSKGTLRFDKIQVKRIILPSGDKPWAVFVDDGSDQRVDIEDGASEG
jgi:hypothetical protein